MTRRAAIVLLARAQPAPSWLPVLPAGWSVQAEDNRWATAWPDREGDPNRFVHTRLVGRIAAARAAFVLLGPRALVLGMADAALARDPSWSQSWAGALALREAVDAAALALRAAWVDERPRDLSDVPIGERVLLRAAMAGFTEDDGEREDPQVK